MGDFEMGGWSREFRDRHACETYNLNQLQLKIFRIELLKLFRSIWGSWVEG
jgi:hypothetical protein